MTTVHRVFDREWDAEAVATFVFHVEHVVHSFAHVAHFFF